MDEKLVLEKYPDLKGLYIPHEGEIIRWGRSGCAIVASSPLDYEEKDPRPLTVISLNGGNYTINAGPFKVHSHLLMGPYEGLSLEHQEQLITLYKSGFSKVFRDYPDVKAARQKYLQDLGEEVNIEAV